MKNNKIILSSYLIGVLILALSLTSYSQTTAEKIQASVLQAEELWNATSPDKTFNSEGNTMAYGLGYLKSGNYSSAAWSFEELLNKNKNNAFANFFMGCVKQGQNDNAAAQQYFNRAGELNRSLKGKAGELVINSRQTNNTSKQNQDVTINNNSSGNNAKNVNNNTDSRTEASSLHHYKTGDKVEISHAGGWWPGIVTRVDGGDRNVTVTVDYTFKGMKGSANYNYNGVRPATGQITTYVNPSKPGSTLIYGDYILTLGLGSSQTQKGFFTIYANGTYSYFGVKGTYTYNPKTGIIIWNSGTFHDWGKNTSAFTSGNKVSQIDMTYTTNSGPLYYMGGHNIN